MHYNNIPTLKVLDQIERMHGQMQVCALVNEFTLLNIQLSHYYKC